jgi:hypothetical protein
MPHLWYTHRYKIKVDQVLRRMLDVQRTDGWFSSLKIIEVSSDSGFGPCALML